MPGEVGYWKFCYSGSGWNKFQFSIPKVVSRTMVEHFRAQRLGLIKYLVIKVSPLPHPAHSKCENFMAEILHRSDVERKAVLSTIILFTTSAEMTSSRGLLHNSVCNKTRTYRFSSIFMAVTRGKALRNLSCSTRRAFNWIMKLF